jgi:Mn-dependent DtxR family transcriptional regulator
MKNKDKIIKYNLLILLGVFVGFVLMLLYSKLQVINTFVTILELLSVIFVMSIPLIYSIIKLYKLNEVTRLRAKRLKNAYKIYSPDKFDYNTASDIDKRNYLIIRLYKSSIMKELYQFYVEANDFSLSEIENLLSNVIDIDFNTFIYNYIVNLKDTNEIVLFQSRLFEYIDKYILNTKCQEVEYRYNASHLYRFYMEETKNDYLVKVERFDEYKDEWILLQVTRHLTPYECDRVIDRLILQTNEFFKKYNEVKDINLYALKISILDFKYCLKRLDDQNLIEYIKYYGIIKKKGHKYYLKLKDNNINLLLKILPPNLKNNLELCLKNKKYYITADRMFESYEEEYFDRLDELSKNEKYNILK